MFRFVQAKRVFSYDSKSVGTFEMKPLQREKVLIAWENISFRPDSVHALSLQRINRSAKISGS